MRALPPLEALEPGPKQKVMRTFTTALGIPCLGCHAESDFAAETQRKRVAKRMWNELVRVLQMSDGAPKPDDIRGPIAMPRLPTPEPRNPEDCGAQSSLCPLDRWMRLGVAPADAANDGPALARALERVARFAPDPSWSWDALAKEGAAAAAAGDLAHARRTCGECHRAYKAQWREHHRTRVVP